MDKKKNEGAGDALNRLAYEIRALSASSQVIADRLSKRLAAMYVEEVYKDLQNIMKKLLAGIQEKLIEIP